jgi:hypothetical protein
MEALQQVHTNEREFLSLILQPLDNSVYGRLFNVETFIDEGLFLDAMANVSREDVDLQVSYEFQNVRAYLYYLTLKARMRSYQASFRLAELVDRSSYSFNPETIIYHIRESSRLMTQLAGFLPYCQASINFDLTQSIFLLRMGAFYELEVECFQLLLFMLAYNDIFRAESRSKDMISALKYFSRSLENCSQLTQDLKFGFEFENKPKLLGRQMLPAVTSLFERIFFFKKTDAREMVEFYLNARSCAQRMRTLEPLCQPLMLALEEQIETRIQQLRSGELSEEVSAETNFRGLVRKAMGRTTFDSIQQTEGVEPASPSMALSSLRGTKKSILNVSGGGELRDFMRHPSIVLEPKRRVV